MHHLGLDALCDGLAHEENIARSQVPVHHAVRVHVGNALADLQRCRQYCMQLGAPALIMIHAPLQRCPQCACAVRHLKNMALQASALILWDTARLSSVG